MVGILQRSRACDTEDEKGENETERSGISVWIMFRELVVVIAIEQ